MGQQARDAPSSTPPRSPCALSMCHSLWCGELTWAPFAPAAGRLFILDLFLCPLMGHEDARMCQSALPDALCGGSEHNAWVWRRSGRAVADRGSCTSLDLDLNLQDLPNAHRQCCSTISLVLSPPALYALTRHLHARRWRGRLTCTVPLVASIVVRHPHLQSTHRLFSYMAYITLKHS